MRTWIGMVVVGVGYLAFTIAGLWSLGLIFNLIVADFGFWGVMVSMVLFPVAAVVAPIYAVLAHGNWQILAVEYGGLALSAIIFWIGKLMIKPAD